MSGPLLSFLGSLLAVTITGAFLVWSRRVDRNASREQARLAAEQADKTRALERQKVSRDDFDSITRELRHSLEDNRSELDAARVELREAREDIKALRTDLDEEQKMRSDADDRAAAAEQRADEARQRALLAEREVERLSRRVTQLEQVLREAGVSVPSPLPDPTPPSLTL